MVIRNSVCPLALAHFKKLFTSVETSVILSALIDQAANSSYTTLADYYLWIRLFSCFLKISTKTRMFQKNVSELAGKAKRRFAGHMLDRQNSRWPKSAPRGRTASPLEIYNKRSHQRRTFRTAPTSCWMTTTRRRNGWK